MKSTMDLLDKALSQHPAPYWHDRLKLNRTALHVARNRGHISPAIAGALAEEMGEDPQPWIVLAALESERDSACKTRMVRRFVGRAALASAVAAVALSGILSPSPALAHIGDTLSPTLCIMLNERNREAGLRWRDRPGRLSRRLS